jgi:hypothetical protein
MIPPKRDAKKASEGNSKMAITGVIIRFSARKLGAPMNMLIGTRLVIT